MVDCEFVDLWILWIVVVGGNWLLVAFLSTDFCVWYIFYFYLLCTCVFFFHVCIPAVSNVSRSDGSHGE